MKLKAITKITGCNYQTCVSSLRVYFNIFNIDGWPGLSGSGRRPRGGNFVYTRMKILLHPDEAKIRGI